MADFRRRLQAAKGPMFSYPQPLRDLPARSSQFLLTVPHWSVSCRNSPSFRKASLLSVSVMGKTPEQRKNSPMTMECDPETGACLLPGTEEERPDAVARDQAQIFYIGDPMCSWCWGMTPVIDRRPQVEPTRSCRLGRFLSCRSGIARHPAGHLTLAVIHLPILLGVDGAHSRNCSALPTDRPFVAPPTEVYDVDFHCDSSCSIDLIASVLLTWTAVARRIP